MSKLSQLRCAAVLGLASACASATPPLARVTAVEPLELRASRSESQVALPAETHRPAAPAQPRVLLVISAPSDPSGALHDTERARIAARLEQALGRSGFAASTREASPTSRELAARGQTAFAVAPTIERVVRGASLECRIAIRIAPWQGRDADERWDSGRTALVHAAARVDGRPTPSAARDCVEAAIEDATAHHVVRFLDRVAIAP